IRPEVAEETDFTFTLFRFSYRDEVDRAVVVVVERGHAPGANPTLHGKRHRFKTLPLPIAPERDPSTTPLRKSKVHPTIVIKVQNGNARGRRGESARPHIAHEELAFARIGKDGRRLAPSRQDDVHGAIIVIVGAQGAHAE